MTTSPWPSLPIDDWTATRETLHMWLQIVGKIRLKLAPMINHWWQVPLYVTIRGLGTSAIPYGNTHFEIEFDFTAHELVVTREGGERRVIALTDMPVSEFYAKTMSALSDLGIEVSINTTPVELPEVTPFEDDQAHATYDPDAVHKFWGQLTQTSRVMHEFRSRFIGKVSPVHFFWGGMDLAVTRFSGREAPRHPGGSPHVGDWVMVEGYSHEVSSCGFWPGGGGEGMFYAYAYPEPAGFAEHDVLPDGAFYYADGGQFLLPYTVVREAADPDQKLLDFFQSTYEAAAILGNWERARLEDDPVRRANPR